MSRKQKTYEQIPEPVVVIVNFRPRKITSKLDHPRYHVAESFFQGDLRVFRHRLRE